MKKLYFLLLAATLSTVACKKDNTNPTPEETPVVQTMTIKITGSQLFSYTIIEADTVTNDFGIKEGDDVTSLNYGFTPIPGHKVLISAATRTVGPENALSAVITYKGKSLPVTPVKGPASTYISLSYVVPKP